jgi:hypothetical protein
MVEYHPGRVWKILDDLGWNRQRQVLLWSAASGSSGELAEVFESPRSLRVPN